MLINVNRVGYNTTVHALPYRDGGKSGLLTAWAMPHNMRTHLRRCELWQTLTHTSFTNGSLQGLELIEGSGNWTG